jgi:hypothetical protein
MESLQVRKMINKPNPFELGMLHLALCIKLLFHIGKTMFHSFQALICTTQEVIFSLAYDYRSSSPTLLRCGCILFHMFWSSTLSSVGICALRPLGICDWLWFHWFLPKKGWFVTGPSLGVPLMPFFFMIYVSRNENGN